MRIFQKATPIFTAMLDEMAPAVLVETGCVTPVPYRYVGDDFILSPISEPDFVATSWSR